MASTPPTEPDPRTAADDDEDATELPAGVSAEDPAEGSDGEAPEQPGSPAG